MTIKTDVDILNGIENQSIVIDPLNRDCIGSNSVDVHLSDTLLIYKDKVLNPKKELDVQELVIPDEGLVIQPRTLYLASTVEYTETLDSVPMLEGKSSLGRLGLFIHATAGRGDIGFKGHWTMELSCVQPVKLFAGMKIAQLFYFNVESLPRVDYSQKESAKYNNQSDKPMASQMHKNFKGENDGN